MSIQDKLTSRNDYYVVGELIRGVCGYSDGMRWRRWFWRRRVPFRRHHVLMSGLSAAMAARTSEAVAVKGPRGSMYRLTNSSGSGKCWIVSVLRGLPQAGRASFTHDVTTLFSSRSSEILLSSALSNPAHRERRRGIMSLRRKLRR